MGGRRSSILWICAGDVSVRRRVCSSRNSDARGERVAAADVADAHLGERGKRPRLGSGGERLLLEVVRIHGGDLIQRFLLLSRARERAAVQAPARAAEETTLASAPTPRQRAGAA